MYSPSISVTDSFPGRFLPWSGGKPAVSRDLLYMSVLGPLGVPGMACRVVTVSAGEGCELPGISQSERAINQTVFFLPIHEQGEQILYWFVRDRDWGRRLCSGNLYANRSLHQADLLDIYVTNSSC